MRLAIVCVLACASAAHADPAPTFAIDLRGADPLADPIAQRLEAALREVGAARGARYRAVGTHADRVAASTDACPSAGTSPACAAEIGARLGVAYVFAGTVTTHGPRFELALDIVNTDTRRRVRAFHDLSRPQPDARAWAKTVFARAVDTATGSLAITCSVSRARVIVDGQPETELYQRQALIAGLALGRHAVELRAPGYRPYVDEVEVDGDTTLNVLLVPASGP